MHVSCEYIYVCELRVRICMYKCTVDTTVLHFLHIYKVEIVNAMIKNTDNLKNPL